MRPEDHDPGAGMEIERALSAEPGRHRVLRILVSDTPDRAIPRAAG